MCGRCVEGDIFKVKETIKILLDDVFFSVTLKLSNRRLVKIHLFLLSFCLLIFLSNYH